jgi:hypothetical protein
VAYADPAIRLAVRSAIAAETARGWRIAKDEQAPQDRRRDRSGQAAKFHDNALAHDKQG